MLISQAFVSGLISGSAYALLALGLVIIFKATGAVNFAQGELFMVGAYMGLVGYASLKLPYPLVLGAAFLLACGIGFGLERLVLRRVLMARGEVVAMIIATVGFSVFLKGLVRYWGFAEYVRSFPPLFPSAMFSVAGAFVVTAHGLVILVTTVVLITAVFLFFNVTRLGKAMQAVSQNSRAAALVGISVPGVFALSWSLSSGIGAIAGVLVGPVVLIHPEMGLLLNQAFAAAIIGGIKNLPGAICGGFIVGILENMIGLYVGSEFIVLAPFIGIIVILVFKPEGILAWRPKRLV